MRSVRAMLSFLAALQYGIENPEKFNEIILELQMHVRTEDGALFCVYLLKETRFIRCRYFSSFFPAGFRTVPVRGRERMKFCGE